jgi:hypothetical protein
VKNDSTIQLSSDGHASSAENKIKAKRKRDNCTGEKTRAWLFQNSSSFPSWFCHRRITTTTDQFESITVEDLVLSKVSFAIACRLKLHRPLLVSVPSVRVFVFWSVSNGHHVRVFCSTVRIVSIGAPWSFSISLSSPM